MSKKDDSSISILYDLCQQFYNYEQHLKNIVKEQIHMSYLIDINSVNNLKKQINYDEMEKYFERNISLKDFKEKIKNKIKEIETNLIPEKFETSKDLILALNNNKKFYFITNFKLTQKICDKKDLSGSGIKFLFHKEKIIIRFNENDELLIYNNSTGIIEKSLLINNNSNNIEINSQNLGGSDNHPSNNYKLKFKADFEILIRLFYYNRFLKEKNNLDFKTLNQENYLSTYLINNNWMEKFKSYYEYNDLENYLFQVKDDQSNLFEKDYISEKFITKIISNLPETYINKLRSKNRFDKTIKFNKYDFDKIIETKGNRKVEISYLINNQLINYKIYELLMKEDYKIFDQKIKKCNLYFIGNKRLLLLFNRDIGKYNDEIGFINEQNIFIPEYVLNYINNNTLLNHLNNFFNNNFKTFLSDNRKENCDIYNENNSTIGKCFRIKEISNSGKEGILNYHNNLNNNTTLDVPDNEIQKYIELFIQFYLFYQKMKNKLSQSLINSKEENYYIIQKNGQINYSNILNMINL